MARFIELIYFLALFIIFVNALDQEEYEADVKWVRNVIKIEVPELAGDCAQKAAELCAHDFGGDWGGSVNCARGFWEETKNCALY